MPDARSCCFAWARPDVLPERLFDVQIAAGLVGFEYPAGYGSLMFKLLGQRLNKGETRTDWRRRPLSTGQIEYALDDVRYLDAMAARLRERLSRLNRDAWLETEMNAWKSDVEATRSDERWWKVSGISGLSRRGLAIVRELWRWREAEARRRDCPTRRVLRDDLIIELAKRKSDDPKQIRALRGMERGDLQRACRNWQRPSSRALALSDDECPSPQAAQSAFAIGRPGTISVLGAGQHLPRGRIGARASWVPPATCAI